MPIFRSRPDAEPDPEHGAEAETAPRPTDGVVTLCPSATQLDAVAVRDLLDDAVAVLAGEADEVVIDLSNVALLDSICLGLLIRAQQQAKKAGGELSIRGCCDQVRELFRITNLDQMFNIETSGGDAAAVA